MQVEYTCQYLKSTKSCPELDHETALSDCQLIISYSTTNFPHMPPLAPPPISNQNRIRPRTGCRKAPPNLVKETDTAARSTNNQIQVFQPCPQPSCPPPHVRSQPQPLTAIGGTTDVRTPGHPTRGPCCPLCQTPNPSHVCPRAGSLDDASYLLSAAGQPPAKRSRGERDQIGGFSDPVSRLLLVI
jgi:hypothetical protein